MSAKVELKVDGQDVRLNPFVQKALLNVIAGFIAALDDVPVKQEKIEIRIEGN